MAQENDTSSGTAEGREFSGKTVDDAISKALTEFGLRRDQVEVSVISEGRPGILGVGAQPARVQVTPVPQPVRPPAPARPAAPSQPAPRTSTAAAQREAPRTAFDNDDSFLHGEAEKDETRIPVEGDLATESAVDVLQTLLQLMGIDGEVSARQPVTPGDGAGMMSAVLDVTGVDDHDVGLLVGRRGETLSSLQYILNLIVNHQTRSHEVFSIDVEGYRRRRENALRDLALRIADRVRQSGQAMTLEPMPPAERRIVHIALADDPDVQTISIGEGEARKVAITPRR